MKVLFVTSESNPFIKTGGLGDVMGTLPQALKNLELDARVILPKYKCINEKYKNKLQFVKWFIVSVGWRQQYCGLFQCEYKGVIYYFLDNEYYFKRDGLYGYEDDAERFAFFNRAALLALKEVDWQPDILHCNDWQTGMVPVILEFEYKKDLFYHNIKTIFSIHNLHFKGIFTPKVLPDLFGYDYIPYRKGSLEH